MSSLIAWIEITITGFLYLAALLLLTLPLFGIENLRSLKRTPQYLPYLAILTILFSYVMGMASHAIVEKIIAHFYPAFAFYPRENITLFQIVPEHLQRTLGDSYSSLMLFRHLTISTCILAFAMLSWFWKKQPWDLRWKAFLVCLFFFDIFLIAYAADRIDFMKFREALFEAYNLYAF
jgi:hypothetical protein